MFLYMIASSLLHFAKNIRAQHCATKAAAFHTFSVFLYFNSHEADFCRKRLCIFSAHLWAWGNQEFINIPVEEVTFSGGFNGTLRRTRAPLQNLWIIAAAV
jgi:hypothetical protein